MAAKLQCEICGGKLIGRPGGVFECDSCGMEYDTAWAKAKIQEITGTVKVEGTVEVTGKVQVDGPVKVEGGVNKETLLQRGRLALEDGKWDKAKEFFDQALTLDAEYADAWLGLAMADLKLKKEREFTSFELGKTFAERNPNYKKFLRFATPERVGPIQDMLEIAEKARSKRTEESLAAHKKRQEEEAAKQKEKEKRKSKLQKQFALGKTLISAGGAHTVACNADGSVVAVGFNKNGECNCSGWKDIIAVSTRGAHTVGLKADGTVVASGDNDNNQCAVSGWRDIIAIAAGNSHTVGLKADGTVIAMGRNDERQCAVSTWKDIVAIAAGDWHTVGLKADGTVVAVGSDKYNQCRVAEWKDIVAIAAGGLYTVGLKSDGSVVAVGANDCGQINVKKWKNVIAIAAGGSATIGMKADGTIVAIGADKERAFLYVDDWENVVACAIGGGHTVGVLTDGTVVAAGRNDYGQSNVTEWKLFDDIDMYEEERAAAAERNAVKRKAATEKYREELKAEQAQLTKELPTIKGIFAGSKKAKIESRLAEIAAKLKALG